MRGRIQNPNSVTEGGTVQPYETQRKKGGKLKWALAAAALCGAGYVATQYLGNEPQAPTAADVKCDSPGLDCGKYDVKAFAACVVDKAHLSVGTVHLDSSNKVAEYTLPYKSGDNNCEVRYGFSHMQLDATESCGHGSFSSSLSSLTQETDDKVQNAINTAHLANLSALVKCGLEAGVVSGEKFGDGQLNALGISRAAVAAHAPKQRATAGAPAPAP